MDDIRTQTITTKKIWVFLQGVETPASSACLFEVRHSPNRFKRFGSADQRRSWQHTRTQMPLRAHRP